MSNSVLYDELTKFDCFSKKEVKDLLQINKQFNEKDVDESLNHIRTTVLKNSAEFSPAQIVYSMLHNMDAIENSEAESECFTKLFSKQELSATIDVLDKIIPNQQLGSLSAVLSVVDHKTGHSFIRNAIKWIWTNKRETHTDFVSGFGKRIKVYLKLSHACLRLWKRKKYTSSLSPLLHKGEILKVVEELKPGDTELASYILDRIIVNKLWQSHARMIDDISWSDMDECLIKMVGIDFQEEKLNFYVRMSAYHFAYYEEEREHKLKLLLNEKSGEIGEFEHGMVHYLLAARMKLSNPKRLDHLAKSLHLMDNIDKYRQNKILKRIMQGQVDEVKEEEIEANLESKGHLERVTEVLRFATTQESVQGNTKELILNEARIYLEYLISSHRQQCGNCNAIHPERESLALDISKMDELLEVAFKYQLEEIQDLCTYAKIVTEGIEVPDEFIEDGFVEIIHNQKKDPTEHVFGIYKLQSCKEEDIFGRFFGSVIHISSKYFKPEKTRELFGILKEIINSRKENAKHIYRFEYILNLIIQLEELQPEDWGNGIYSEVSGDIEKWLALETSKPEMVPLVMDVFWLFYFPAAQHPMLHETKFTDDLSIITKSMRAAKRNPEQLQPLSKRQFEMVEWWSGVVERFLDVKDTLGDDYQKLLDELGTTLKELSEAKTLLSSENWIGD